MQVVTRFAPSPTGFLHIGGARTALFSWLYAKRHGGTFLLRIEDTDRARSTDAAVDAILEGLTWLELDWHGEAISQFARRERHADVARAMVASGNAYYCYATPDELEAMREKAKAEGRPPIYDGRWRDRPASDAPAGVAPAVRLKAPRAGSTTIDDRVQGTVTVANEQLDDMVLLRADGTPTYMLSVVVDDHDMGVTHVIRGDDHLTNAFRQWQIYEAMGWDKPIFAHIPLIHGPDGAKLSKRHGALGVDAYRDMGYLPEAMRNYLLRLGWSHGDDEIISTEQAIDWFDLEHIGRSPSRFDFTKLASLNGHYLRQTEPAALLPRLLPFLEKTLGRGLNGDESARLLVLLPALKERAKTLVEIADSAAFLFRPLPLAFDDKAKALLDADGKAALAEVRAAFAAASPFEAEALEEAVRALAEAKGLKLGKLAQPLRAALTGSSVSPPIFLVAAVLGREATLKRIDAIA
jgi:glutamyl-tRNA synthetase